MKVLNRTERIWFETSDKMSAVRDRRSLNKAMLSTEKITAVARWRICGERGPEIDIVRAYWRVWGQGGVSNGCDGLVGLNVSVRYCGCNGCDGLLELTVWGQGGGCNGCDGLLELTMWGQDGGCNGCNGLLEITCEIRTVDVMVVIVCYS
jgi:hypothetical protein